MESVDVEDIDPATTLIISPRAAPAITSDGDTDWLCGDCDEVLLRRCTDSGRDGIVFRCSHCFRFNRFRQAD